jgi:hypothetical protein
VAVLHLALEIDGDVHPELYAMLAALITDGARGERVRQLASTGLLWEVLRAHGHLPAQHQQLPAAGESRAAALSRATPPERRPTRKKSADFVDLAIDAVPEAEVLPPPLPPGRGYDRDFEAAIRELPVLNEVIDPSPSAPRRAPPAPAKPRKPAARRGAEATPRALTEPAEPAAEDPAERPSVRAPLDEDEAALIPHKPAVSSRLMRMKEKGLFKNG